MAGLIEQFKKQFEELKNSLENALKGEDRRKREVESLFRVKRAEDGEAEPEAEPEGEDYYCIKKTMGENTVKSCLPKVLFLIKHNKIKIADLFEAAGDNFNSVFNSLNEYACINHLIARVLPIP